MKPSRYSLVWPYLRVYRVADTRNLIGKFSTNVADDRVSDGKKHTIEHCIADCLYYSPGQPTPKPKKELWDNEQNIDKDSLLGIPPDEPRNVPIPDHGEVERQKYSERDEWDSSVDDQEWSQRPEKDSGELWDFSKDEFSVWNAVQQRHEVW
eukprot:CAMPEP_0184681632 /NCGR_PEP_ID=MMETSP0312-20130426/4618_1 /TAXON_ID=31354 /ORGANISM="Compsopogon coeruleus, Strain SAG 36.94" /LENGTH=151 /DNA_ID=CAMNT_0027132607 /DNA_START=564 /DNA_END=1016 /DNA_ORIENTATION=+